MQIQNRRYTGNKFKLLPWIKDNILRNCKCTDSFFDVFGGTGVVSATMTDFCKKIIINDLLYSNEVIYKAFFLRNSYSSEKLDNYEREFNVINADEIPDNYVSLNFGGKYFNYFDSKKIGFIREKIEFLLGNNFINKQEYYILLASLIYSLDRVANTVGHYEAYIKKSVPAPSFKYELIAPVSHNITFDIFREDANCLARRIQCDIAFLDPPYNSRQYSRFYHVLETITKWNKPVLSGVALKPPVENMSDYCRSKAATVFDDLVKNLNAKYIVVTYNNTYDSKSSSSQNKITLEQIENALNKVGNTKKYSTDYHRFNAGKTVCNGHKEFLFITSVVSKNE